MDVKVMVSIYVVGAYPGDQKALYLRVDLGLKMA